MKKLLILITGLILFPLLTVGAQTSEETKPTTVDPSVPEPVLAPSPHVLETGSTEGVSIMTEEEFVARKGKFFFTFDEGLAASWNTRIIKQTGRTNFVFKDFLAGLYFTTRTNNFSVLLPIQLPVELFARVAAYYPLTHSFNDYPQPPVNMLNFGADILLGSVFQINFFDYLYLDLGLGIHSLYQKADRWHYVHLGLGGIAELQMPIARRWTIHLNGIASLDNPNLGSNKHMEPYDLAWQYQVSLGVRYSKRAPNPKTYIPTKKTDTDDWNEYVEKETKRQQRKAKKQAEKARKEAEKAQKQATKATKG